MPEPKVTDFSFSSSEGVALIKVERQPDYTGLNARDQKPRPDDVPPDIRDALRVWLAGNQA